MNKNDNTSLVVALIDVPGTLPHLGNKCLDNDQRHRFTCKKCQRKVCHCAGGDTDDRFAGSGNWCNDCWYWADLQEEIDNSPLAFMEKHDINLYPWGR